MLCLAERADAQRLDRVGRRGVHACRASRSLNQGCDAWKVATRARGGAVRRRALVAHAEVVRPAAAVGGLVAVAAHLDAAAQACPEVPPCAEATRRGAEEQVLASRAGAARKERAARAGGVGERAPPYSACWG